MCTGLRGPPRTRVAASPRLIGTGFLERDCLLFKLEFSFDDARGGCCCDSGSAKLPIVSYGDGFGGGGGGSCVGGGGGGGASRLPFVPEGENFGGGGGGSSSGGWGSCGGGGGAWPSPYAFLFPSLDSIVCRALRQPFSNIPGVLPWEPT